MTTSGALDDADAIRADVATAARAATSVAPLTLDDVARLIPGRVAVPPPARAYGLFLAAVALATVVLPILYLGLVAVVARGVWWHATTHIDGAFDGLMRMRNYFGPLVIGLVLLFFLLKPLMAPRRPRPTPCTVSPHDEPVLHSFVRAIAHAIGASEPVRIDVDIDVNASAAFRRGWRSFGGGDLVLTLGTPLVEGMSLAELGGVLAHELGHFRQGWGMRASYAIHAINAWLHRAVNGRDAWDDRLARAGRGVWVLTMARGGVWLTRRILWVLMAVAATLAAALSRRMEIDADEHELALVGSTTLTSAMRKIVLLDAARATASQIMERAWDDRLMPDDAPALVRSCRARLDEEAASQAVRTALAAETDSLSTHPCVAERIAHARARAVPAQLACDLPARALLREPDTIYRRATQWQYSAIGGVKTGDLRAVRSDVLMARLEQDEAAVRARERVTRGVVTHVLPLAVSGGVTGGGDPTATRLAAAGVLDAQAEPARHALDRIDNAATRLADVARCRAVRDMGADPRIVKDIDLRDRRAAALDAAEAEARAVIDGHRPPVDACHAALRDLIASARGGLSEVDARRFDGLSAALDAISAQAAALEELRTSAHELRELVLLERRQKGKRRRRDAFAEALGRRTATALESLRAAWSDVPHPYGMHGTPAALAAIAAPLDPDSHPALFAERVFGETWTVYFRALAELCDLVERGSAAPTR